MPITLNCQCGKRLQVKDEYAGRRAKCPACSAIVTVPTSEAEPEFEVVEDDPPRAAPVRARPTGKPRDDGDEPRPKAKKGDTAGFSFSSGDKDEKPRTKGRSKLDSDEDEEDDDRPRRKRRRDDDDDEDDRPRKRKPKRRKAAASGGNGARRVGYVLGGIAMLLIGAAIAYFSWQSEARKAGKGVIFGAFLALCGGASAVKGVTGNIDDDEDEDEDA